MRKIRFAIGTEKYEHLHHDIFLLANEALRRGHHVSWFEFNRVREKGGIVILPLRRVQKKVCLTRKGMLSDTPAVPTDAELMDVILIRKSPPQKTHILKLLGRISENVAVINNPRAILAYRSKKNLKRLKGITNSEEKSK